MDDVDSRLSYADSFVEESVSLAVDSLVGEGVPGAVRCCFGDVFTLADFRGEAACEAFGSGVATDFFIFTLDAT